MSSISAAFMTPSVQPTLGPMELKSTSFRAPNGFNSPEAPAPDLQLGAAVKLAASRANLTLQQIAAHMDGLDAGTFSKQLDGQGHLALNRLLKVPPAFWHEFLPLLAAHYGMSIAHSNGVARSLERFLIAAADVVGRMELVSDRQKTG